MSSLFIPFSNLRAWTIHRPKPSIKNGVTWGNGLDYMGFTGVISYKWSYLSLLLTSDFLGQPCKSSSYTLGMIHGLRTKSLPAKNCWFDSWNDQLQQYARLVTQRSELSKTCVYTTGKGCFSCSTGWCVVWKAWESDVGNFVSWEVMRCLLTM